MNTHPSLEQLERLLQETLSDTDRLQVAAHVDQCGNCQVALDRLTNTAADIAPQLRQTPTAPTARLEFLDRIKQAPPLTGYSSNTARAPRPHSLDGLADWQEALQQHQEFRILEKLGQGGFGVVFKAYDARLDQLVAIKVLHPDLAEQETQRLRFEREARKAAAVRHDHVVTVYRLGQQDGLPFIVMEFIQGEPLSARLKREGKLAPLEAAEIVRQVALGLAAAHSQNVVHRDIKPSNILLDPKTNRAKIADFGIAREIEGAGPRVTSTNERPGTLEFMSPEHLRNADQLDGRSDLYSLGVVLYELLTGELPFRGQTHVVIQQVLAQEPKPPRRLNDRIPADLETITLRCLAKEPARRYQSAQELAEDLQRFLNDEPILARPVTPVARVARWFKRRPAIAGLLAASVVAVLALVGVGIAVRYNTTLNQLNGDLEDKQKELTRTVGKLDKARAELEVANGSLTKQNDSLATVSEEVKAERLKAVKSLYVTQVNMAHQAWQQGDIKQAGALLGLAESARDQKAAASPNKIDLHGFEWYYLKSLLERGKSRPNLAAGVSSLAVWPGGKEIPLLATVGEVSKLWQPVAGKWQPVQDITSPAGSVRALTFSMDGKLLAGYAAEENSIELWKIAAGKAVYWRSLKLKDAPIHSLAFTPDGTHLAAAHADRKIRIVEVASGTVVGKALESVWPITQLAISPDGGRLVCGAGQYKPDKAYLLGTPKEPENQAVGQVLVWDDFLKNPGPPLVLTEHNDLVTAVAISPDGKRMASASFDHTVRIWDSGKGQKPVPRHVLTHGLEVMAVVFSPDGKHVASGGYDMLARVWDSNTGHPFRAYAGHEDIIKSVAFLPAPMGSGAGNARLLSLEAGALKSWPLDRDQRFTTLSPHDGSVLAAVFGKNHRLLTLDGSLKVRAWDVAQQKLLATLLPAAKGTQGLALSPAGDRLALVGNGKVQLVPLGDQLGPAIVLGNAPTSLDRIAFSANGKRLAVAGMDRMQVWDLTDTAKPPRSHMGDSFRALTFTSNGRWLAFVDGAGQGMVWDLDGQAQPKESGDIGSAINQIALSPDGKLLAAANEDYTVTVWDVVAKKQTHTLKGHTCYVSSVAFSPDGKRLASGSEDWTIRLWDLDTALTTLTLKGHEGRILTVAFHSNGQQLVSTSEDGTARVWAAPR